MSRIGLYYPSVHFRDEAWIKLAALYWGKMARMVPSGYELHDSPAIQQLKDDLNFVINIDPALIAGRVESSFMELIKLHGAALSPRYLVWNSPTTTEDPSIAGLPLMRGSFWSSNVLGATFFGQGLREGYLGHGEEKRGQADVAYVAMDYFGQELIHDMIREGLAVLTGTEWRGQQWLALHPRFAAVYMTALAEELAASNDLEPVTDSPVSHVALSGWTMPRLAQALLEDTPLVSSQSANEVPDQLGMLAIESVIPKDLAHIPMSKIIEIRFHYERELAAFRTHLDALTESLTSLSTVQDPGVLQGHLEV